MEEFEQIGETHLLLIAINNYRDRPPLQAATNGASELKKVLTARYGVIEDNVHWLPEAEATALGIENALSSFRPRRSRKLTDEDTLIVYFAGHGEFDEGSNRGHICGYEVPNASNRVSFDDIRAEFRAIAARHILFICDSCFSGGIFRSSTSNAHSEQCYRTKSREALTSGNLEIVGDLSKGGQTAFNHYLTQALWKNENATLLTSQLHAAFRENVSDNTDTRQHVIHSPIPNSGHEIGGELVLFLGNSPLSNKTEAFEELMNARQISKFETLIDEKTQKFVGRAFLTSEILSYLDDMNSGILFVTADPGFGKTTWAAQLCTENGFYRHFIDGSQQNGSPEFIRENLARQILSETTFDKGQIEQIDWSVGLWNGFCALTSTSQMKKSIIVIDGIDELSDRTREENITSALYLFDTIIPQNTIIIAVGRRDDQIVLPIGSKKIEVDSHTDENYHDIRHYFEREISPNAVQSFLKTNSITLEILIDYLVELSEGNFMYAELIIPHLQGRSNAYNYATLDEIPAGLERYYEDHWRKLKINYGDLWFEVKLPVLVELSMNDIPISVDQIIRNTGFSDRHAIRKVLSEWAPFLRSVHKSQNQYGVTQYSIYHKSFKDFITNLDVIEDEKINLKNRLRARTLRNLDGLVAGLTNEYE